MPPATAGRQATLEARMDTSSGGTVGSESLSARRRRGTTESGVAARGSPRAPGTLIFCDTTGFHRGEIGESQASHPGNVGIRYSSVASPETLGD
jgi:hypothetical protein